MTRKEIFDNAKRIAHQTTSHLAVDPRSSLYDMSVAEQRVENWAGVVHRTKVITLDPASLTGSYPLPPDFLDGETLTWSPPVNNPPARGWTPVRLLTPDAFRQRMAYPWPCPFPIVAWPSGWPSGWPVEGSWLYAMVEFAMLTIWPIVGTGVLNLTYHPILTPYSPSDPNWADFGADPESQMEVTGLADVKMGLAIDGITRYVAAQMLRAQSGGYEQYGPEIRDLERQFKRSITDVARASIGNANTTPQRLQPMGGLR